MPVIGSNSEVLKEYLGVSGQGSIYLGGTQVQYGTVNSLLDDYPAVAAYSLRRLRNSYTGPAVQIRQHNTLATKDIYFLADGQLDTGSVNSFMSGDVTCSVSIWYDQSGNGIDLTSPTAGATYEPKIAYTTGSMVRLSGSGTPYAIDFQGNGVAPDGFSLTSSLNAISSSVGTITDATVISVENAYTVVGTAKQATSWCDPNPAGGGYSGGNFRNTITPYYWTYNDSLGGVQVTVPMTYDTPYVLAYNYNRTGDNVTIQANTVSGSGIFATANTPSWDTLMIGGYPAADHYTKMNMSEWIMFSGSLSQADVDVIRYNVNDYYNCY